MSDPQRVSSSEARARGYDPAEIERIREAEAANAEAADLIPEIESAFDGVPRPTITLSVAKGLDDEWELSDERLAELSAMDSEQRWQDVTLEAVEARQEYFILSDADGWRFYLPAYMIHCLRSFPWWDWVEPLRACCEKTHVELLSEAQLRCVDRFVGLCKRHAHEP